MTKTTTTMTSSSKEQHMRVISPYQALRENQYAVVTRTEPVTVYDLYNTEDTARRICRDLNKRYADAYEVAAIDFGGDGK